VQGERAGPAQTRADPYSAPAAILDIDTVPLQASRRVRALRMIGWVVVWCFFGVAYRIAWVELYAATMGPLIDIPWPEGMSVHQHALGLLLLLLPFLSLFAWGTGRLLSMRGPVAFLVAAGTFLWTCVFLIEGPLPEPSHTVIFVAMALLFLAWPHRWRSGAAPSR
jgi:hypothetical protein